MCTGRTLRVVRVTATTTPTGVATGNDPETLYMVTAGAHFNGQYVRFVSVAKPLYPAQTRTHTHKYLWPPEFIL